MPRTQAQFSEMRENSRRKIIQTALKLFSTYGVHATSMQKIAREAGVAAGLVYNYFKSKDDLLDAIIKQALAEIVSVFESKTRRDSTLGQLLEALFETVQVTRESWRLLIRILMQPEASAVGGKSIENMWGIFLVAAGRHFRQRGEKQPERKARAFTELVHGAMLVYVFSGDKEVLKAVKHELMEAYRVG